MIETKIHEYIQQQRRLLELELRSEQDETSTTNAKEGIAKGEGHGAQETRSTRILRNLQVDHLGIGLLGRSRHRRFQRIERYHREIWPRERRHAVQRENP